MDTKFTPKDHEEKIYDFWEKNGYLKPGRGKPFTILMPPPNANASLHAGHGMYTVDDIMIRWKRLQGYASLWIPGMDHAGFETQYVYEKHLAKQGKSRMDFDRQTLYENIFTFVQENSGLIYKQFKRLGFLADWERSIFTLDPHIIQQVFETFKKMESEGKVYRDAYIVNYCVHCGTSLAELEVKHVERIDPLYYIRYPLADGPTKFVVVATVRPEPIFIDTHLAVNPKDKKNNHLIGKKVKNPLTSELMEIIGDEYVDPEFGTGVVKLTPGHDPNDFQIAKKKGLPIIQAIDWRGRMVDVLNKSGVHGMKVKAAREDVVKKLQNSKLIEKIDDKYVHSVITCYKCGRDLEPMTIPNWFIKVDVLKKPIIEAVEENKIKFYPQKYKKQILQWLDIMHDWPISRQIVWGIRIPVWYKVDRDHDNITIRWIDEEGEPHSGSLIKELHEVDLENIKKGLQKVVAVPGTDYVISLEEPTDGEFVPETDTFDTWFSSGQWPLVTLQENEFSSRFPTDMMGTLADILKFWVSRMILFSLYLKNEVPFKNVYLWSMVADTKGKKMAKSKGNVINPIEFVDKYGADAFRASLLFGIGDGGTVILSEDKVRAMRNFANKIWNVGRFILINKNQDLPLSRHSGKSNVSETHPESNQKDSGQARMTIKALQKEFATIKKRVIKDMDSYKFSKALDALYEFLWHRLADFYIEELKEEVQSGKIGILKALEEVYLQTLVLLHPFVPFVTEAVWKEFRGEKSSILDLKFEIGNLKKDG